MLKLNATILLSFLFLANCSEIIPKANFNIEPIEQEAVDAHNRIRAEVLAGAEVTWSSEIANTAQIHADYLASTGLFEHEISGYGENLFASSNDSGYIKAINSWYKEKSNYNYEYNSCSSSCGHYTQIIWEKTTEIGCAKATYISGRFKGGTVIVCRYNPQGNVVGRKPY